MNLEQFTISQSELPSSELIKTNNYESPNVWLHLLDAKLEYEDVKLTPFDDVELKPLDDAKLTPFDDVELKPLGDAKLTPFDDVELKPMDVKLRPFDDVKLKPMDVVFKW